MAKAAKKTTAPKKTAKKVSAPQKVAKKAVAAPAKRTSSTKISKKSVAKKTKVVVRFDVGLNNSVYLRGDGPSLSWDKGTLLKNQGNDTWVWETTKSFRTGEFKVLINDLFFEAGDNRQVKPGEIIEYTPDFPPSW